MQHLSRRFSGFVFLYAVIAGLLLQGITILSLFFPESFMMQISPEKVIMFPIRLISFFIIFLPPLIFISARRYPFLKLLRVNTFSLKHLWYTIGISVCLFLFIRMLDLLILGLFNTGSEYLSYFNNNFHSLWSYIITFCLIPAFFEVMIFQGVIHSGFHDLKPLRACLYTGLLFALYIQIGSLLLGTIAPFEFIPLTVLGFVFSYISYKAGSILPGMIASFLYYFFSYADIEDRFYFNCLMPLGISENLAIIVLAMLSVIIGGILLVKMPTAKETRALRIPSPRKIVIKLIKSREKLKRSWLWREENGSLQQQPAEEDATGEISVPEERPVYPDNSEKQQKGAGFKTGIIIIIAAVLCDLGITIYFILTGI